MPAIRAFLVEDSPLIRENLIAALEEMAPITVVGYADDEPGALHWLGHSAHACELLIIDIFLKRGSGLVVLREASALGRPISRVVLSNYTTPEMRRHCLALGASHVFDKSNDIDAFIQHCSRLASGDTGPGNLVQA